MKALAAAVRIPEKTLGPYIRGEKVIGKSAGRPGHLCKDKHHFAVDSVRRRGRGRDGLDLGQISAMVKELNSGLSAKQATNTVSFLRAQNNDVLTKSTEAQATITARVAVNFPGQCRWLEVRGYLMPYALQLNSYPYSLQPPVKF
jgi:hypothetical protein